MVRMSRSDEVKSKASLSDAHSVNQCRNTARVDSLTDNGRICESFAVKIHAIDRYFPTAARSEITYRQPRP